MTLNRRGFLAAGMGIGIGAAGAGLCHSGQAAKGDTPVHGADVTLNEYERILATTNLFNTLGRPRSWSVVQQGFLPISPERVLILYPEQLGRLANWWRDKQARIRERMREDAPRTFIANVPPRTAASAEQLGLILWLTNELTRFYSVPQWWDEWSYNLAYREALGTTGFLRHGAMPHQFQYHYHAKTYSGTPINTVNAMVDWWMVLIPGGTKHWGNIYDLPIHAIFTHVLQGSVYATPGDYLRILCHAEVTLHGFERDSPNAFIELSRMDRVSAARLLNRHVVAIAYDYESRDRQCITAEKPRR